MSTCHNYLPSWIKQVIYENRKLISDFYALPENQDNETSVNLLLPDKQGKITCYKNFGTITFAYIPYHKQNPTYFDILDYDEIQMM